MCIVIDTNVLNEVFNLTNPDHHDFAPVYDWIMNGKGKIVFGGTKYKEEIGKYFKIFSELKKQNKVVLLDKNRVDEKQNEVTSVIQHRNYDDPHMVAILICSKCKIICSKDKRAYPYFQHKAFFKGKDRPKIYSGKNNRNLLQDCNIAQCCLPHDTVKVKERKKVLSRIKELLD